MWGRPGPSDSRLREKLRLGDPASEDSGLEADERRRMRQRLVREVLTGPAVRRRLWRPAFAVGLAVLFMAVLWRWPYPPRLGPHESVAPSPVSIQSPPSPAPGQAPAPQSAGRNVQQIHFVTRGGTRVIWLLTSGMTP